MCYVVTLGLGCILVEVLFKHVLRVCVVSLESDCVVYEVLSLPLSIFYWKVFEDVYGRTQCVWEVR